MNGRTSIFRRSFLLCLILLMAACKKDDDGGNRSPIFDTDAGIAAQTFTQNVEIPELTLPQATGGDGTLIYTLSPNLPQGLTFDATQRTITGTPEGGLPQTSFTYTATDEDGDTAELTFTISIDAVPAFADDAAIADQTYTQKMEITALTLPQATGGDGALSYTLSPNLPQGLTFDATKRTITGTPQSSLPQTTFTYTVTDEDGDTDELNFMMTINETLMPAFATDAAIADQTYTHKITIDTLTLPTATGGDGALTYTLSPNPPQGLTFDNAQRTLTGTPEAAQNATQFTYTATDEDGDEVSLTFMITINESLMPAFATDAAIADQTYTQNVEITDLTLPQATGGDGALTYTISPNLPTGLSFDADARRISGRASKTQTATEYNYTATDEDGDTATLTFMITIEANAVPAFANDASVVPQIYTETKAFTDLMLQEAKGGNGDLTYSLAKSDGSALPDGLTFSAKTRVLSGRPQAGTAAGATDYTLTATDRDGDEATLNISITIRAADAMPITLNAGTQRVTASSTSNNATMLTSTVAWEATETETWITMMTPEKGVANGTAQAITLNYMANEGSERMGTVTFTETTAGASPKFMVTLTVTQAGRVPDGMIPINNLEQLNAMRYDLTGDGQVDHAGDQPDMTAAGMAYAAAFPNVVHASGRYAGYQLMRDLNFSNAGSYASGAVNADWTEAGSGEGWLPVGVFSNDSDGSNDAAFLGTFDGGGS